MTPVRCLRSLRSLCLYGLAAATALAAATTAQAQAYPTKPVRIVVAYAAGGGADALARAMAGNLSQSLGQQFVVENKPGAGGISAAETVAKSPADGYTVLLTDTQYVISPSLFSKLPYDPTKDLTGVSLMTRVPLYLAVKSTAPFQTLQDFVKDAKAHPGKYNYGSAGIGSLHHIAMESFKASTGLDVVHVPYKGSGQSVVGFLGGETTVLVASLPSILPHIKAGNVKLLAVSSLQRSPQAPEVPPMADIVPGYDFSTEIGLLAPTATPPAVVKKLSDAVATALKDPALLDRVSNVMGASAVGSTPAEYATNLTTNIARYAEAVKVSGAKVE